MIKLVILDGDNDGTTCTVFHLQIENEMEFLFCPVFLLLIPFLLFFFFLISLLNGMRMNENCVVVVVSVTLYTRLPFNSSG